MMGTLSAIAFAFPHALWALMLLPLIWWLLHFTPPRPETVRFPPFRFLLELTNREEDARHTPWWLILIRLALAAAIIIAVAAPYIDRGTQLAQGNAPRLIILDDGWAAAKDWPARQRALNDILDAATNAPVSLALTSPTAIMQDFTPVPAQDMRNRIAALKPKALNPSRLALADALAQSFTKDEPLNIIWLSDGLDDGTASAFTEKLALLNNSSTRIAIVDTPETPAILRDVKLAEGGFEASLSALTPRDFRITATAGNGRVLAETTASADKPAKLELPLELRNEAHAIRIQGETTTASIHLLDDRWKRKRVGMVTGAGFETAEPLLSPLYYVSRALTPFAEISEREPELSKLLEGGLSMLVLADVGNISETDREKLESFIERGGVLVRFAGPRLAAIADDLVPVTLRGGGRDLGSSMGWEKPQALAPFAESSPFAGLAPDDQTRITRQVLAEPDSELAGKTWASLTDGTPLVTAQKRGQGLIILFHITANNDWSNLPLSGLFVQMLRRVLDLAPGLGTTENADAATKGTAFAPLRALDGFGDLTAMPPEASPIPASLMDTVKASPSTPAGLYTRNGATRALNLDVPQNIVKLGPLPHTAYRAIYGPPQRTQYAGPVLALALLLFVADTIASLWITGAWSRLARVLPILLVASLNPHAEAEQASLQTTLAYVSTGDSETDIASERGLSGLSRMLLERTAVEPAEPAAIQIERDELVFYPLIYWPVLPTAPELSAEASRKLSTYMKNGGMVLFDTRDAGATIPDQISPAGEALRRILARLDVPALEPVPEGHVLTKSFYLLQSFPGRFDGSKLWAEQQASASADNVSAILIGANDYAAAWAMDEEGLALYPVTPGGNAQREQAYRVGINIVMYALTGNYKADQVHVPDLLERLGQ
jgi:hypothetical protein